MSDIDEELATLMAKHREAEGKRQRWLWWSNRIGGVMVALWLGTACFRWGAGWATPVEAAIHFAGLGMLTNMVWWTAYTEEHGKHQMLRVMYDHVRDEHTRMLELVQGYESQEGMPTVSSDTRGQP